MPHTIGHLDRLGITAPGRPLRGISYIAAAAESMRRFVRASARGAQDRVARGLWHAAEAAGVKLVHGELGEITQDSESVCAGDFRARYLAAADGLHSPIRKALGLSQPAPGPRRWGIRRHVEIAPWTDSVEVYWAADAEAYVTPVADDCVGIAILSATRGGFDKHFEAFGELRDRVRGHAHGQDRAAGPLRQKVRTRAAGRVLLVGDAAGYIDALTGEGMGLAFGAAELAGELRSPRTTRGLRPPVAQDDAPLSSIDCGPTSCEHARAAACRHRSSRADVARRLCQARQPAC